MNIQYRDDAPLTVAAAIELYNRSTLGERRPVHRPDIFAGMLENANLTVTAWDGERLVGIARTLTDFTYVAYLADLAVRVSHQKQGIGKGLMRQTQKHGGAKTTLLLLAAPAAEKYYPHVGFSHAPNAWLLRPGETIG